MIMPAIALTTGGLGVVLTLWHLVIEHRRHRNGNGNG